VGVQEARQQIGSAKIDFLITGRYVAGSNFADDATT
jgi:hypothetical protein